RFGDCFPKKGTVPLRKGDSPLFRIRRPFGRSVMVRLNRTFLACLGCLFLAVPVLAQGPVPPPQPVPAPVWEPGTPVLPQTIPVPGQPPPPPNPQPVFPPVPIQFPGDEAAIFRPEQKGGVF